MSVLATVPTLQSTGEAEKMILTEGRREYESQPAQWQRGTKGKCSVSAFIHWECVRYGYWLHQCFCNLEICLRGASQISTSFKNLLQIYWEYTCICKIRSQLPAQTRNSLFSMLGIFSGKPQPVHFPLMNLPEADHPKYLMQQLKHLYQKDLIKSYTEFYIQPTDFSWVM